MGLDSFKTESSSSSSTSTSSGSSSTNIDTSEPDEIKPWFTAVIEDETERIKTFTEKAAFYKSGRHINETVLAIIETEDEFERLEARSQELHGMGLETLFKKQPLKGEDFVERMQAKSNEEKVSTCPVCSDEILITEDEYTRVNDVLVHAGHPVSKVAQELELGVQ